MSYTLAEACSHGISTPLSPKEIHNRAKKNCSVCDVMCRARTSKFQLCARLHIRSTSTLIHATTILLLYSRAMQCSSTDVSYRFFLLRSSECVSVSVFEFGQLRFCQVCSDKW